MRRRPALWLTAALTVCAAVCVCAEAMDDESNYDPREWRNRGYRSFETPPRDIFHTGDFVFARIRYTSYGEDPQYNQRGRWTIDYPDSDEHLSWRLSEITTLKAARTKDGGFHHAVVRLTDKELFDYPFVYLIEPGELIFTEEETKGLRDYLLRGGFLMVDDFWGTEEWLNWEAQFANVLDPAEYPMVELGIEHPIFNCVFELKEKPQVTTPWHWRELGGGTSERNSPDTDTPHYKGVFDKPERGGRLMAIICHNTDLGDGWEREGVFEDYFHEISVKRAYPMGINIVVYALTH